MKIVVVLINLIVLAWLSRLIWKYETERKEFFFPALLLKLSAGITVGLIYFYYYGVGDTIFYFEDGRLLAELARNDPQQYVDLVWLSPDAITSIPDLQFEEPRARFLVRVVSLFNIISFDNYWIITLYFSYFSFLGSWFLFRITNKVLPQTSLAAAMAFLFFPSIVFWSSGLIKESLSMAALFFLTGLFLQLWFSQNVKWQTWILVPIAAWILWNLKYYFAGAFFCVIITSVLYKFVLVRFLKSKNILREVLLWFLIFFVSLCMVIVVHPNFYPSRFLRVIVENYNVFRQVSENGDAIQFFNLEQNVWSIVTNTPWALISGLFRPFIWEAKNIFQGVASFENLALLVLFTIALTKARFAMVSPHRMLILSAIVYIFILAVFITLSTPNFGTLSRYRVGYLPFFVYLVCCSTPVLTILQRSINRLVRIKR